MKSFIVAFAILVSVVLVGCGAVPKQPEQAPAVVSNPNGSTNAAGGPAPSVPTSTGSPDSPGQTMQCASGKYDMLDWATMDPDLASGYHLEGNHNPLYTYVQNGKFYWLKSNKGFPWDIQLVDDKNVYLWVTEQDWNDPDTYKKSHNNTNMALTPRCAAAGQKQPGTHVKSADTSFEIVSSCTHSAVHKLGTMNNEVWGPYKMSFGGDIPDNTDTLVVAYKYNCDAGYANCNDREQYYLTQRYGLVRWDHSKLKSQKYVIDNFTVYNQLVAGGPPAPEFPCGG